MKIQDISEIKVPTGWKVLLTDKDTFDAIHRECKGAEGFLLIDPDTGKARFVGATQVRQPDWDEGEKPLMTLLSGFLDKLQGLTAEKFDPSTDLLVAFQGNPPYKEKIGRGIEQPVKAWWCRPKFRSVALLNLELSAGKLQSQAFRDG